MSADNWTRCPQCDVNNKAKAEKMDETAAKAYGVVSAAAWDELRAEARAFRKSMENNESLREDYEIGIYKEKFSVGYSGHCATCGFDFQYKHEEKVPK